MIYPLKADTRKNKSVCKGGTLTEVFTRDIEEEPF